MRRDAPARPALRYHGGKWTLAPWLLGFFPTHRIYVEPFGGAASVLMRKGRVYSEVYNDIDGEVVNLFRVLRDAEHGAELELLLRLTPFAREEFELSYEPTEDAVELARRLVVRCFLGFGSPAMNSAARTGFRAKAYRQNQTGAQDWANHADAIPAMVRRMRGVLVEHKPAQWVIEKHDTPETLFYCDPPYPVGTRSSQSNGTAAGKHGYRHEMTDDEHRDLAAVLRRVAGMVVLSGYACDLYDLDLYADWHRFERAHFADGAKKRTEVIWMNLACHSGLGGGLFGAGAGAA